MTVVYPSPLVKKSGYFIVKLRFPRFPERKDMYGAYDVPIDYRYKLEIGSKSKRIEDFKEAELEFTNLINSKEGAILCGNALFALVRGLSIEGQSSFFKIEEVIATYASRSWLVIYPDETLDKEAWRIMPRAYYYDISEEEALIKAKDLADTHGVPMSVSGIYTSRTEYQAYFFEQAIKYSLTDDPSYLEEFNDFKSERGTPLFQLGHSERGKALALLINPTWDVVKQVVCKMPKSLEQYYAVDLHFSYYIYLSPENAKLLELKKHELYEY